MAVGADHQDRLTEASLFNALDLQMRKRRCKALSLWRIPIAYRDIVCRRTSKPRRWRKIPPGRREPLANTFITSHPFRA